MNTQEVSLLAFLLERIRDEVLVIPFVLPVTVAVGSPSLGIEKRSRVYLRYLLFSSVPSRKKCPHVQ